MPTLPEKRFCEGSRANRSGTVDVSGRHLTTTSGTLASTALGGQDTAGDYTLTKVGATAGRYTVQFTNSRTEAIVWLKLISFDWWVETTGAITSTKGGAGGCHIRGGTATLSTTGAIIIQLFQVSGADAEVDDGAVIGLSFRLKKSSATP